MNYKINLIESHQYEAFARLCYELHAHYHQPAQASEQHLHRHVLEHVLASNSVLTIVVASVDEQLLGFAALIIQASLLEPLAPHHLQCQLKELYVAKHSRHQGIGTALFHWIEQYAASLGCGRIDWHVKASNQQGIAFYQSMGASVVVDRQSMRLLLS